MSNNYITKLGEVALSEGADLAEEMYGREVQVTF